VDEEYIPIDIEILLDRGDWLHLHSSRRGDERNVKTIYPRDDIKTTSKKRLRARSTITAMNIKILRHPQPRRSGHEEAKFRS